MVTLSLIPGLILLLTGTSPLNIIALWLMHLIVAAITIPTLTRVLPLPTHPA